MDQYIEDLENQLHRLEAENKQQEETIKWMHDLIWELIHIKHLIPLSEPPQTGP